MAWLAGWLNRREIIIDHTKVDAALSNFPVMVKLQNLLANGSFETGSPPSSWTASSCSRARVSHMKKFGSYCMSVTPTSSAGYMYQSCVGSIYPELVGKVVTFSCWVWADTPNEVDPISRTG